MATSTSVARLSLSGGTDPVVHTGHSIKLRARVTSGAGTATIRAAIYEGANNRSGDLETAALTATLADYTLAISEANAANITSYGDLEVRFWGYDSASATLTFEVDYIALEIPYTANASADPSTATVTLAANDPGKTVNPGATGHAATTVAAYAPALSVKPSAAHAATTFSAYGATVSIKASPGHAGVVLAGYDATGLVEKDVSAEHAAITFASYDATVSTVVSTSASAGHPAVTLASYAAGTKVATGAGHAVATLAAYAATADIDPSAPSAGVALASFDVDAAIKAGGTGLATATFAAYAASVSVKAGAGHSSITFAGYDATASVPVVGTEASAEHATLTFWASLASHSDLDSDGGTGAATMAAHTPSISVMATAHPAGGAVSTLSSTLGYFTLGRVGFAQAPDIVSGVTFAAFDATISFSRVALAGHASITVEAYAPGRGATAQHAAITAGAGTSSKSTTTQSGVASAQFFMSAYNASVDYADTTLVYAGLASVTFASVQPSLGVATGAGIAAISIASFDISAPAVPAELDVSLYNTMTIDVEVYDAVTLDVRVY